MSNLPWFRFYSEALTDRKIKRVCAQTGQPKALVIGVWATILSLASDSPERGALLITEDIPITIEEIMVECGIDSPDIINAFIDLKMLHIVTLHVTLQVLHVTNWNARQFQSDSSKERVRKYREKKKSDEGQKTGESDKITNKTAPKPDKMPLNSKNVTVKSRSKKQPCNVTVTPPDTESDTESKNNSGIMPLAFDELKKIAQTTFEQKTGLSIPLSKTKSSFWWGEFGAIVNTFGKDPARIKQGIIDVIDYMNDESLTITTPKSISGLCGTYAAGKLNISKRNGKGDRPTTAKISDNGGAYI